MKVYIVGYDRIKYRKDSRVNLYHAFDRDVIGYEVKTIPVEEILAETDESCVDPYDEYLIITFSDGVTSTFRNSYFDLFLIH